MHTFIFKSVTVVMLALFVSACGKRPQVVTGIQVQSSVVDENIQLALKADLDLGNMTFPTVSIPVFHPDTQAFIGSVDLLPVLGGKNQIKLSVNLSELLDVQAREARLPNGNLIPLIATNPTVVVPLGSGIELYLTASQAAVAVGVAVPIKTFDSVGASAGGASLFPSFMIDQVVGAAGIFTSRNDGENGFALIADVSKYVSLQDVYVPTSMGFIQAMEAQDNIKLDYSQRIPSRSTESRINSEILKLNRQHRRLELN